MKDVQEASDPRSRQKRAAADRAVDQVRSGMVVGLGAGSTARFAVARIAEHIAEGRISDVAGVPCSRELGEEAARLGIRLSALDEHRSSSLQTHGGGVDGAAFDKLSSLRDDDIRTEEFTGY